MEKGIVNFIILEKEKILIKKLRKKYSNDLTIIIKISYLI